jgi:hypothetical protein
MLLGGFFLALSASAQMPATAQAPDAAPIVVTAMDIAQYRARLAECLARHCPVNEDVDASLALAEALFLQADYHGARTAILGSLHRNHGQAAQYPEPVSDLFRADARVERHLGNDEHAQYATRNILSALQHGIHQEDYRHFTARMEIADSLLAFGHYVGARDELRQLARIARAAGRDDVAAMTDLRLLWIDYLEAPHGLTENRLAELAARTDPADRYRSIGAKLMLARIYRERGETARSDAMLAGIGSGGQRRQLLFSPPYELDVHEISMMHGGLFDIQDLTTSGSTILARLSDTFENKWIDVGFWIERDGSIANLEIVRQGAGTSWARPLIESIRGRRYSTSSQPTYRLERYTYTAGYEMQAGSHIPRRSPRARVEYLQLTTDDPPPAG